MLTILKQPKYTHHSGPHRMYIAGLALTANSQFQVERTNGAIRITNANGISGKNCVFCADACALGKKYGKEVRRLIDKQHISNCYVIDNVRNAHSTTLFTDAKTVCVLSGDAISTIDVDKIQSTIILLYPQSDAKQPAKSEKVRQILFPEIDPLKNRYLWQAKPFWASKIQLIPYDKPFETTWADYITDI